MTSKNVILVLQFNYFVQLIIVF